MKSLVVIILDESGSMDVIRDEVIRSFDNFIADQCSLPDPGRLFVVKFSTHDNIKTVIKNHDLNNPKPQTKLDYKPFGQTALNDAIHHGIILADLNKQEDEKVLIVIITDGKENDSKEISHKDLKKLIQEKNNRDDWTFLYIGENPLKFSSNSGIDVGDCISFNTAKPDLSFGTLSMATSQFRSSNMKSLSGKGILNNNESKIPLKSGNLL